MAEQWVALTVYKELERPYARKSYIQLLSFKLHLKNEIPIYIFSMSWKAYCWDNAVAESFFSSLKKKRIKKRIYKMRDLARADIFDYIEMYYNKKRGHSHLGGVSPEQF